MPARANLFECTKVVFNIDSGRSVSTAARLERCNPAPAHYHKRLENRKHKERGRVS
jgi:hypothetical protein